MTFSEYAKYLNWLIEQRKIDPDFVDRLKIDKPEELPMTLVDKQAAQKHFDSMMKGEQRLSPDRVPKFVPSYRKLAEMELRTAPFGVNGIDWTEQTGDLTNEFVRFKRDEVERERLAAERTQKQIADNYGPQIEDKFDSWKKKNSNQLNYGKNPDAQAIENRFDDYKNSIDGIVDSINRNVRNRREIEDKIFNRNDSDKPLPSASDFRRAFGADATRVVENPDFDREVARAQDRLRYGREQWQTKAKEEANIQRLKIEAQLQSRQDKAWKEERLIRGDLGGNNVGSGSDFILRRNLPIEGQKLLPGTPVGERKINPVFTDQDYIRIRTRAGDIIGKDFTIKREPTFLEQIGRLYKPEFEPFKAPIRMDDRGNTKSNIVPTNGKFGKPVNVDPYSSSGQYGGEGFNRLPTKPSGPDSGFDIDQIMKPREQSRARKIIPAAMDAFGMASGRGISGNRTLFADKPQIERPDNMALPSGSGKAKIPTGTGTASTQGDRPYKKIDTYGGTGTSSRTQSPFIQRVGTPFVRGAGVAGALGDLLTQGKLFSDAMKSLDRQAKTSKELGLSNAEKQKIYGEYGQPKYVYGLPSEVAKTNGARPFDNSDPNFIKEATRAMRRGESSESFKKRYFGPQDKDGARNYTDDYRNGPIWAPRKPSGYPFDKGDDGYTRWQKEGLKNVERRSTSRYDREVAREIDRQKLMNGLSDIYNAAKKLQKLLDKKAFNDTYDKDDYLGKGRNKKLQKYWESDDRSREPFEQRKQTRVPSEWDEPTRAPVDIFAGLKDRDLKNLQDYLKKNPYREDSADRLRRNQVERWMKINPSKIMGGNNPLSPAPPLPGAPGKPPKREPSIVSGWNITIEVTDPNWYFDTYTNPYTWRTANNSPTTTEYKIELSVNPGVIGEPASLTFGEADDSEMVFHDDFYLSSSVLFSYTLADGSGGKTNNTPLRSPYILSEEECKIKWGVRWGAGLYGPEWNGIFSEEYTSDRNRLKSRGKTPIFYYRFYRQDPTLPGVRITKKTAIFRVGAPKPSPANPPKPEPEDPIMPGCSYQPDRQNPAIVSFWDKLTSKIGKKPIQVHEGVDEGFEHVSGQIAEMQSQIDGIAKVLEVDKYMAPQGKIVAPKQELELMQAVIGVAPLAVVPLVKSLQGEMKIFNAFNYMLSGHHLLGKIQLPFNINGADDNGNLARFAPLTTVGLMQGMHNITTGLIGMPNKLSIEKADGTKTNVSFKNQADGIETANANIASLEVEVSGMMEMLYKVLQNQEMLINMVHKETYKTQALMDDAGFKSTEKIVKRPSVMKHQEKPKPNTQTGTTVTFDWETTFKGDPTYTSVPVWKDEIDKMQLGVKTNMEAQKANQSVFFPLAKKGENTLPKFPKSTTNWESYVKSINEGIEGGILHGPTVGESKIEEIKGAVVKKIKTEGKPFITGELSDPATPL